MNSWDKDTSTKWSLDRFKWKHCYPLQRVLSLTIRNAHENIPHVQIWDLLRNKKEKNMTRIKNTYQVEGKDTKKTICRCIRVDCCLFMFSYCFFLQKNNMKWKVQYAPAKTSTACFMQHTSLKVHSMRIWLWFADLAANIWLVSD